MKIIKKELGNTKKYIYRATSIMFIFQLFGALGAGFFFVVGNLFKVEIFTGTTAEIFWHLCFWATDFFFVGFTTVLAYLIAGIPALAPAMTLSIYFCHFNGAGMSLPVYSAYFSTPEGGTGAAKIGYIGFLVIALMLGYLIKNLYKAWDCIKESVGPKLDSPIETLISKIKFLKDVKLKGINVLELIDLIVLFLILPIVSGLLTYVTVHFCIEIPFGTLAQKLIPVVESLYRTTPSAAGLLTGAMVGFDCIGPLSLAAFEAAANLASAGNAVAVTVYGVCFVVTGWVGFAAWALNLVMKKGPLFDTDDGNMVMTGPINAFFDNMKLTVAFGMTYAYRDPLRVVPCYVLGTAVTGLLAGAVGLENKLYLTAEKLALITRGEIYVSFLQPLRSISTTPKGILLAFFAGIGSLIGGFVLLLLKQKAYKTQVKNGTYVAIKGDLVLEMRHYAQRIRKGQPLWHTQQAFATVDTTVQKSDKKKKSKKK